MLGCMTHNVDSIQARMLAAHSVTSGVLTDFDGVKVLRIVAKDTLQRLLENYAASADVLAAFPASMKVSDICRKMQTNGCQHAGFTSALGTQLAQVWQHDSGGEGEYADAGARQLDCHSFLQQLAADVWSRGNVSVVFKSLLDLLNMPVRKLGISTAYNAAKRQRERVASVSTPRVRPFQRSRGRGRQTGYCYKFNDDGVCSRAVCRWRHVCRFCDEAGHSGKACPRR